MRQILKNNKSGGFTVLEVIIAVVIFTVLFPLILGFGRDILTLNFFISDSLSDQYHARKVIKTISKEIRSAGPQSSIGSYPIEETTSSSFTFYSNIDQDILKERVRYFVDGGDLKKGVIKPSGNPLAYNPANEEISVLVRDMVNDTVPVFEYYDVSYDGTSQPLEEPINQPSVRLVKVTVIIDDNPDRGSSPITVTTQISLRNLKENL